jgi:hypothetical protein
LQTRAQRPNPSHPLILWITFSLICLHIIYVGLCVQKHRWGAARRPFESQNLNYLTLHQRRSHWIILISYKIRPWNREVSPGHLCTPLSQRKCWEEKDEDWGRAPGAPPRLHWACRTPLNGGCLWLIHHLQHQCTSL